MNNDEVRALRRVIDAVIYDVEAHLGYHSTEVTNQLVEGQSDAREMAVARTKLQEARMWMGDALVARGGVDDLDLCEARS